MMASSSVVASLPPIKIGIAIPTYPGNRETVRCLGYLALSESAIALAEPEVYEFKVFLNEGEYMPRPAKHGTPEYIAWELARCQVIGALRWKGFEEAFAWGAEWVAAVDTDVMVPVDFWPRMLHVWPDAEAKTCDVIGTREGVGRKVDFHYRLLPPDALECDFTGEVYMLRRSLYERMEKTLDPTRPNEDVQMGEQVRKAGATYKIVRVLCMAD
jgi:hypothetical protein